MRYSGHYGFSQASPRLHDPSARAAQPVPRTDATPAPAPQENSMFQTFSRSAVVSLFDLLVGSHPASLLGGSREVHRPRSDLTQLDKWPWHLRRDLGLESLDDDRS